jgi:hypothetical protein
MAIRTGRVFATACVVGVLTCTAALGQNTEPGDQQAAAYHAITLLCQADAERFCPSVDQTQASPRDQMMCLKIYRADLTLNCRRAVKAVTAATQPP